MTVAAACPGDAGLSGRMARGVAWMVLVKLLERGLGLLSTMVLARLLVPADFGLVAMATTLAATIEVMSSFSFDLALIQNQNADRRHYDTAWTFTVLFGLVTAAALLALATPAALFFNEPRVAPIVCWLALSAFIQSFQNVGIVAFRKELDFRREFALIALQKAIGAAVAVTLALLLRSYWALVAGIVVSKSLSVAVSYLLHPFRPRFSLAAGRELMRFSSWLVVNNIVIFGAVKGYDFIVGRLAAANGLGLYSVAYEISNLPTTEVVYPVSRAIFPGFSKMAHRPAELRRAFIDVTALVALITIPLGAGIAVLAEPLVRLMLGPNWLQAVPLIRILAVYGILRATQAGTGDVYLALGVHRVVALINLPHIVIGWALMAFLYARFGIEGAAAAVLAASAVAVTLNSGIVIKVLSLRLRELFGCYWRPLAGVAVMCATLGMLTHAWRPHEQAAALIPQTCAYVLVGATAYVVALVALWLASGRPESAERILLKRILPGFAARTMAPPAAVQRSGSIAGRS